MKTRLLKKIRKRYKIIRIDEIASDANPTLTAMKRVYSVPFYKLSDGDDDYGICTEFFKTFEEARERLCEWIICDYEEKFRHRDEKSSKVWYD